MLKWGETKSSSIFGKEKIKKKSVILIDFGVKSKDYCSDISRMVFINPSSEILNIYEKLLVVQKKSPLFYRP